MLFLEMTENQISGDVVDVALRIHRGLGPGLFESVYEAVMASELEKRGLRVAVQQIMPVVFEGVRFEMGFRADLVVEEKVIIEIKSVSEVLPVHKKQLLTYLRLSGKRLGLLINFNEALLKDGIVRIANGLIADPLAAAGA
jgi:GxxExxY protein